MKNTSLLILLFISFHFYAQKSILTESLLTIPEKTNYQKTSTYAEVMSFIKAVQNQSDLIHLNSIGTSKEGKEIPLVILSDPKISTPEEAKKIGKPVMFVMGNIHAGEVEGKEILLQLMRDILFGDKKHLLDSQVLLFAPIYNTDSNDKMEKGRRPSQEDSPVEVGIRSNSQGFDLNRDGVKMEAFETQGLIKNVLVKWNPEILVDLHTTNGTWHGYGITTAPSYHSAGEVNPYLFIRDVLLPEVTKKVDENYEVKLGHYGYYFIRNGWPPKAIYTYNHHPRYIVNQMGLRNKMGILSEAFAHDRFYKRMNGTYGFAAEILEFTNKNAQKIVGINKQAEQNAIKNVIDNAGEISKGVRFKKVALDEKITDYRTYNYIPFIDNEGKTSYARQGNIVTFEVENYAKFETSKESKLPRGYYIPKQFKSIIKHLRNHGVEVDELGKNKRVSGEIFNVENLENASRKFEGHFMAKVEGKFIKKSKTFKKGDYYVDMAQPLTNLIFYLLEPQSDDGLVTWNFFDAYFKENRIDKKSVEYPVFKHF